MNERGSPASPTVRAFLRDIRGSCLCRFFIPADIYSSPALSEGLELQHTLDSLEELDDADSCPIETPGIQSSVGRVQGLHHYGHPMLVISSQRLSWLPCSLGAGRLIRLSCSPSARSQVLLHWHWKPEQGAGPRGGKGETQRGAIREGVLEAVVFPPGLEEWGGHCPAEIDRWHRGWGSSTHTMVEAGKTGCAWCVV